jgi:hypothetical protein
MPNRIPTKGIPTPAVRVSKAAQPAAKPAAIASSEAMLKSKMATGSVKDLAATKKAIMKKTGVWPNGDTN